LHTRDDTAVVAFYRSGYRWDTRTVGDSDQFRHTTMRDFEGDGDLAGIMDSRAFLPRECRLAGRSATSKTLTPARLR